MGKCHFRGRETSIYISHGLKQIHTLELKLRHFKVFPIGLNREAIHLQSFTPTRYVSGRGHAHTYKGDDLYPICSKLQCREPACIYYTCSYTVAISPGIILSFAVLHTEKLAFQCATC